MTSASELFYNRRSRNARNATDLGIGYTLERNLHHPHPNRRHSHHRGDDCDPLRRSPHSHARHLFLRGFQTVWENNHLFPVF
uniref:Uncharacterized protein n=1 Tax=Nelumbo nucifera TaxID=4432 RepID=A0A822ZA49_NELNU|nr:TPA_asm: hypothetical protein HUJ06_015763 [Nelumbo nucifera]